MIGLFERLFSGEQAATATEPATSASIEAIDQEISSFTDDVSQIAAQIADDEAEVQRLAARNASLALPAHRGDGASQTALDVNDARLDQIQGTVLPRLRSAQADAQRRLEALGEQKKVAVRQQLETEMYEKTATLRESGRAVHKVFATAARELERWINDDTAATQAMNQLKWAGGSADGLTLAEGRFIGDRVVTALAHYLMPAVGPLIGTSVELSVTDERRHLDFITASVRPFSPPTASQANEEKAQP